MCTTVRLKRFTAIKCFCRGPTPHQLYCSTYSTIHTTTERKEMSKGHASHSNETNTSVHNVYEILRFYSC